MIHPEFTVVLDESNGWDVFLDGEREYFGLDDVELARFARDFRSSNSDEQPAQQEKRARWITTARSAYGTDDIAVYDDALIDASPDDGAWVQGWLWVSDSDLDPGPDPTSAPAPAGEQP